MRFEDFYNTFINTFIYKQQNQNIYNFKKIEINSQQYTLVKIKSLKRNNCIITLHLKEGRYSSQSISNIYPIRMILVRLKVEDKFIRKNIINQNHNNLSENRLQNIIDSKGNIYGEERIILTKTRNDEKWSGNICRNELDISKEFCFFFINLNYYFLNNK